MFGKPIPVARVAGVEVKVDPSTLIIAFLVAWSFWARFTEGVGGHSVGVATVMAVIGTVLFFASVLIHELAHALEARHRGMQVRDITLYVFGGATAITSEPERPIDEFAFTGVGPYSNLVLGALFGLVYWLAI